MQENGSPSDAMYKFFIFLLVGGGVITDLKLINFVIKHQFNPQLLKIV